MVFSSPKIFLALLLTSAVNSFAQNFQTKTYTQKEKTKPYEVILGKYGNNYYTARASGPSIIIIAHDSTLAEVKQASFTSVKYMDINFNFYYYAFIKGNLYLFYSGKHLTKNSKDQLYLSLIATKVDLNTLQTVGDPRMITEGDGVPVVRIDENDAGSDDIGFVTRNSPNEEFLLISFVQNFQTKIIVTDKFFNWIYGSSYSSSFSDQVEDIAISNKASVALLHKQATIVSEGNDFDTQPWVMVKFTKDTQVKSILNSKGYKLYKGHILFTNNDVPCAIGHYWNLYTPNAGLLPEATIQRNVGTFFFSLKDTALKMYPFDAEFIMKYKSDGDKRTIKKEIERGGKPCNDGIYTSTVFKSDKDMMYLVGEENWGGSPVRLGGGLFIPNISVTFNTNSMDRNMIVTQFDSSGKLLCNTWVLKNQVQSEYSTYLATAAGDSLYILFNDDMTNMKKLNMNEVNDTRFRSVSAGVPVLVSMGAGGAMNKYFPFTAKPNSVVYFRDCSRSVNGEFILQRNVNGKLDFDVLEIK